MYHGLVNLDLQTIYQHCSKAQERDNVPGIIDYISVLEGNIAKEKRLGRDYENSTDQCRHELTLRFK